MSRPRTPFGNDLPGRMPATVVKVLAAEMSDPGRLTRGKRYWSERAVIDIVIGHGAVTAEVQGSRPAPYVVTIETRAGIGAPSRRDLTVRCTCPDDDGTGQFACKHAVAALFALSDEVAIEPEVLARWRRSDSVEPGDRDDTSGPVDELAERRRQRRGDPVPVETAGEALGDALAELLVAPAPLPAMPPPAVAPNTRPADPLVAEVLDDALDHLRIRWD